MFGLREITPCSCGYVFERNRVREHRLTRLCGCALQSLPTTHLPVSCLPLCVCVCVYVCACAHACLRACVRACIRACMCVCVRACPHYFFNMWDALLHPKITLHGWQEVKIQLPPFFTQSIVLPISLILDCNTQNFLSM